MPFDATPRVRELAERIHAFMNENVYPNERRYFEEAETLGPWKAYPVVEELIVTAVISTRKTARYCQPLLVRVIM